MEPKNYHAWSHRIWVVDQVQNYAEEINFAHTMLQKDPYNNSVWAYRSYIISKIIQNEQNPTEQYKMVYVEICECIIFLEKSLNNQAAWNYLRGYFPSIRLKDIPCENKFVYVFPKSEVSEKRVLEFVRVKI